MKFVLLIFFICVILRTYSQDWVNKINDPDYKLRLIHGLKVGDEMPDLPLGTVINNYSGATRFSDLRGKLVILDFWHTVCSSCIDDFPKMEDLQKKFGDKIQIILVNPTQSYKEITQNIKNFKFPELPCIVKDSSNNSIKLWELFPSRSSGHQVWIDGKGIIGLRGASQNNTPEKISDFLTGKKIFILNDNGTAPVFDTAYPYNKLLGDFKATPVRYVSAITSFNNEYDPETNGIVENVVDSIAGTRRNTYVNVPALNLFSRAFKDYLKAAQFKVLYGPSPKSYSGLYGYHFFILPKDTLRYTGEFSKSKSDKEYMKPRLCYEQIVPLQLSDSMRRAFMLQDLNRYFGGIYGTEAKLEKRKVPCYVLVQSANSANLITRNEGYYEVKEFVENGKALRQYSNASVEVIGDIIRESNELTELFLVNSKNGKPALFLNESGFKNTDNINVVLPQPRELKTMNDLKVAVKKYGLDIREELRELQFVVITDSSNK